MKRKIYQAGAKFKNPCPICDMRIEKGQFWQRDKGSKVHRECFKNKDEILVKKERERQLKEERMKKMKEELQCGYCAYCGSKIKNLEDLSNMEAGKGLVCSGKDCKEKSYGR